MRIFNSVTASALALVVISGAAQAGTTSTLVIHAGETYSVTANSLGTSAVTTLAVGTKVPAQQSTVKYSTKSGVTSGFGNYARATSTVVYDSASDTYTLRDTGSLSITSSFGPANVDSGASSTEFTVYSKNGGNETFRLLNKSAVPLTYVQYGEWKRSATASGTTSVNDTFLVFGDKTTKAQMPHSGSASYTTMYDGNFVDKDGEHALDGTGTMTASFGSGSLGYTATINGAPDGSLAFAGTGSISYAGNIMTSNSTSGYTLSQYGNFYGPAAEEVGGLFKLSNRYGQGQGAFVGN